MHFDSVDRAVTPHTASVAHGGWSGFPCYGTLLVVVLGNHLSIFKLHHGDFLFHDPDIFVVII